MNNLRPYSIAVIGGVLLGFSGIAEMAVDGIGEFKQGLMGEPLAQAEAGPPRSNSASQAALPAMDQPQTEASAYEEIVAEIAAAQGGQISQRQLAAIAEMSGGNTVRSPPTALRPERPEYGRPAYPYSTPLPQYERRSSSLDVESASRKHLERQTLDSSSFGEAVVLNPAGPGLYSGTNGDVYTQAGPNGVVNTRTGEFSPKN